MAYECGSIGQDFCGGFYKFSLRSGLVEQKINVIKVFFNFF